MASMKIFVKKQGSERPTELIAQPADTISSIKQQVLLESKRLWKGRQYLKDAATLKGKGIKDGDTITVQDNNQVPKGYGDYSHYKASLRVKAGLRTRHHAFHKENQKVVKERATAAAETSGGITQQY